MANIRRPRKSSLQFWPRTRPKKETPVIKSWPTSKLVQPLGFAGYKAGMTHITLKDNRPTSPTKGDFISWPVTVVECPPIRILSLRVHVQDYNGPRVVKEIFNPKVTKELARTLKLTKKKDFETQLKELETMLPTVLDVKLEVYTQPSKTGIGKKNPEIFEMGLGGTDLKQKIDYFKNNLDKELRIQDFFKAGTRIDVHSVSKGKGFQGTVKRFGVALRSHKSEKKRRGNIMGPERPGRVHWGMLMPGRMGYNLRTEYNKTLVLISDKPEKINPKGGFMHYGLVKNDYVLIKGSVAGPAKRLIRIQEPIRGQKPVGNIEVVSVSQESKQ
ncbi:MAG: 50S ribosomal protein L3 [Candidatus Nanoarchaeia archaeon]